MPIGQIAAASMGYDDRRRDDPGPDPVALSSSGGLIAASLATVVIGGLLSSTLLTLVVIPVIYSLSPMVGPQAGRHPARAGCWQLRRGWRAGTGARSPKPGGQVGFDFLGFHIQQFPVGKAHTGGGTGTASRSASRPSSRPVWVYWASRLGRHPDLPYEVALLLKRQAGKCAWCGFYFRADDVKERDHLVPTSAGEDEQPRNRQLLHGHCHHQKTAQDGSYAASGTRDKGH